MSCIRIECEICNKLINSNAIKSHLKTCGQETSCRFCNKKYCTPYYRKQHELTHNKNNVRQRLTCLDCNANFSATSSLNTHKKKCFEQQERRKKLKTVALQPFKRVANVYVPKNKELITKIMPADVIHLPDEDIAAVETITSDTTYNRNETQNEEFDKNWQKVIIQAVPQLLHVNSKSTNIKK